MKKRTLAGLMAVCMALGLAGCGGQSSGNAGSSTAGGSDTGAAAASTAAPAAETSSAEGTENAAAETTAAASGELKKVDVILDWYPNAIHTFLFFAKDKGYFADEGLDVTLTPPAESVDALTFVASGRATIGLTYPIEVIQSADTDMKVRAIGAVNQTRLGVFTTLADSGVTSDLSTLKGKTVGYDGTASSEALVKTAAQYSGLSDSDYSLLDVGFDLTTALTTKSVDMTAGMMLNDEVVTMKNSGYDVVTFPYSDYGVPECYEIVMVANDEAYQQDPDLYNAFLRACYKGFQDMKASEDDSLELIMSEMNTEDNPLDEDQQRESYEILLPTMETGDASFLSMKDETWQEQIDWMKGEGLIENDVKASDIETCPQNLDS